MKKSIILCLSIILVVLTGCKKDKNTWGKLEEGAITIEVGQTYQLTFTHDGNVKPLWTSEDASIATVDENGLVTGVRVGSTNVAVNGLACKVTVIDNLMGVIEPMQNWAGTYEDVNKYMSKEYGNITIPDLEYDTFYNVISEDEIDTIIYVKKATFDYSMIIEDHFSDKYEYAFELNAEFAPVFISAQMTVNNAHVAEIPTYLNNRYVKDGDCYRAENEWGSNSYIYNESPVITFKAKQAK